MIKHIRKFLLKIIVAIIFASVSWSAISATNLPGASIGDIGDYGSWATDHNRGEFLKKLIGQDGKGGDLREFQEEFQKQIVRDYVPFEARIGIAMVNGLNNVAKILDRSLVRFMIAFILIMYVFWVMLESYNMMSTDQNVKKLLTEIIKKTFIIAIWLIVLRTGPAQLFMYVVGPIASLGVYISDFILNAITQTAGIVVPDTCNAIREYAAANVPSDMIIDAAATADIMCVPTRLSGFFVTAISAGWKWMIAGIGHSLFTFIVGAIFVGVFAWNTWKFGLMALAVIMNLFLGVMLLPFTALAESIPQTTQKGAFGKIFNSFIGLFNAAPLKLTAQINKFINAAVYFVSLSIVIAICAALLSSVIDVNLMTFLPALTNEDFLPALLAGALTAWLATKADSIARDIGGSIPDDGTGKQFTDDLKTVAKNTYSSAESWVKAIVKSKK